MSWDLMKEWLQQLTWPWMSKLSCWLSSSLLAPISLQNSSGSSTPSPHVAVAVTRRLSARLKYGGVNTSGREGQAAQNRTVNNPTSLMVARRLFFSFYYYSKLETGRLFIFVSCGSVVVVVRGSLQCCQRERKYCVLMNPAAKLLTST